MTGAKKLRRCYKHAALNIFVKENSLFTRRENTARFKLLWDRNVISHALISTIDKLAQTKVAAA